MLRAAATLAAPAAARVDAPRVRAIPAATLHRTEVFVVETVLVATAPSLSALFHLSPVAAVSPAAAVVGSVGRYQVMVHVEAAAPKVSPDAIAVARGATTVPYLVPLIATGLVAPLRLVSVVALAVQT
jgi:hypothetical protein